jgi:hypothetical protein
LNSYIHVAIITFCFLYFKQEPLKMSSWSLTYSPKSYRTMFTWEDTAMNRTEIYCISIGIVIAAVLQYYDWLFALLFGVFLLCIAFVGIYLSVSWSLVRGKQYKPTTLPTESEPTRVKELLEKMMVLIIN